MRVPQLLWDRRHNVAVLHVSFSGRIWGRREVGDLVLAYNALGRLARVVFLDPGRALRPDAVEGDAIRAAIDLIAGDRDARDADLDVLRSALARAGRREAERA